MSSLSYTGDCAQCSAWCCRVYEFTPSEAFAEAKPALQACNYLSCQHRCQIHPRRSELGYSGCIAYDCYGAGQLITQKQKLAGPLTEHELFRAYLNARSLLEQCAQLTLALSVFAAEPHNGRAVRRQREKLHRLLARPLPQLVQLSSDSYLEQSLTLLRSLAQQKAPAKTTRLPVLPG